MLSGLLCKNKVGFVDGTLPCPAGDLQSFWIIFLFNDSSGQLRTQLILKQHEPSIQHAFSLVVQEVEQRHLSTSSLNVSNVTALMVRSSPSTSANNRTSNNVFRKKECPLCAHCRILGHVIDRCYKLHG